MGSTDDVVVSVTATDFLWFIDTALHAMGDIVRQLGDELANRSPAVEAANSPFAILTHCLGVMEFWGGVMVAGRTIERDRAAEFRAEGSVDELLVRVDLARHRLADDLRALDSLAPPVPGGDADSDEPYQAVQGAVLLHIMEELFQHLGQMEISRDLLVSAAR